MIILKIAIIFYTIVRGICSKNKLILFEFSFKNTSISFNQFTLSMSHSFSNFSSIFIFIRIINGNIFQSILKKFSFNNYSLSSSKFTFTMNWIIFHHSLILIAWVVENFATNIHFAIFPKALILIPLFINHKSVSLKLQILNTSLIETTILKIISLFITFNSQFVSIGKFNSIIIDQKPILKLSPYFQTILLSNFSLTVELTIKPITFIFCTIFLFINTITTDFVILKVSLVNSIC